ncbi:hypothetical protein C8N36_1074 [Pelagimonas varians]|uniref:Mrr restriction system protein n=1 Tax=Pelagimonas varians TaxID=696760 RepID=A0A238KDX5_9RHOB|nr:hypothetical protein C8N36_1074 [Pelagimonas varians]SMX41018.1 hypothetical protein PEV8663_02190 [Pelagimonas varians]
MSVLDPLFSYLTVLSVIQPGRVQDVERFAPDILPQGTAEELIETGAFREAHYFARVHGHISPVRRGTFFLTAKGREVVRRDGLHKELDNLRLFLMKGQRGKYK